MGGTVSLEAGTAGGFRFREAGVFRVAGGPLWLTRAGDSVDYCLEAGRTMLLVPGDYACLAIAACTLEWLPARRPMQVEGGLLPCPA